MAKQTTVEKTPNQDTASYDADLRELLDQALEEVGGKLEEHDRRLGVLTAHLGGGEVKTADGPQHVPGFYNELKDLTGRVLELEDLAAQIETGTEVLPAALLGELTPAKMFLACVQSLLSAAAQVTPQMFLDHGKPQNRITRLRTIVDISYEMVLVTRDRMPSWKPTNGEAG